MSKLVNFIKKQNYKSSISNTKEINLLSLENIKYKCFYWNISFYVTSKCNTVLFVVVKEFGNDPFTESQIFGTS